jgi:hypothetical protein
MCHLESHAVKELLDPKDKGNTAVRASNLANR